MRSDIAWLKRYQRRPFRRLATRVMAKQTYDEIVESRKRIHDLAVEVQCWRDATQVGQRERMVYEKARLAMSHRGVIPNVLRDDDFKRAPND